MNNQNNHPNKLNTPPSQSENIRKELEDKNKYINVINSFHEKLFEGYNYGEVAEAAVESLVKFSGSPAVALFGFNAETEKITINSHTGFNNEAIEAAKHIQLDNSITGRAISTKEIQYSEALNHDESIEEHCSDALSDDKFKSVCSVPLLYGQTPIGAINLIFKSNQDFRQINKHLLMSIAKTISIALQNTIYINKISEEYLLREKEEKRYKAVVQDQREFIVRWLPNGERTFANKSYCNFLGIDPDNPEGGNIFESMKKVEADLLKKGIHKLTPESNLYLNENTVTSEDGRSLITEWSNRGIFNKEGKLVEIQSVGIDLTEIRNAQEEIEENRQKFTRIFESSPNIIIITDTENTEIIDINHTGCNLLGYSRHELVGKKATDLGLLSEKKLGVYLKVLNESGSIAGREITFKNRDGADTEGIIYSRFIRIKGKQYLFHTIVDITERKRVEEQLKESESKYRLLIENQNDFILKFTTKGKILYASPNFFSAFGVGEKDVINNYFLPEIHPDDIDKVNPILRRALEPGYRVMHEERMKTVNGWRWIAWSNKPIELPDGTVKEIISVGRDINERKEAEIELQWSSQRFRHVLNSLPEMVVINDLDDNTLYINQALEKETGLTIDMLNNSDNKFQLVHPDDLEKVIGFVNEFIQSDQKTSRQLDNRFIHKNGDLRWHASIITKIELEGRPALLYLTRDITDRKKDEEEIRKLALIAKETINGVTITNRDKKIEWVNEGFERITGYNINDVIGRTPGDVLQGIKTSEETRELLRLAIDKNTSIKVEILNYKKNGEEFWNELTVQPMYDDKMELTGYIGIISDVSERKEAENERRMNETKLSSLTAHLQKVRERERQDIARGIHDELGQLLTALKINIRLLQRKIGSGEDGNKSEINNELDALSKLVDESVKSSKRIIKDLRPELLDKLGPVVAIEEFVSDFCELAGLSYKFNYNTEELELEDDIAIGIFRTVQEALNNTVKYAEADLFEVDLIKDESRIILYISDNGKGFDKIKQNKNNSFGLLGMRERILNFGGEYELESSKGKGTKIKISVPLSS